MRCNCACAGWNGGTFADFEADATRPVDSVGGGWWESHDGGVGGGGEDCGVAREDGVAFTYGYLYSSSTWVSVVSKGVFSAVEDTGGGRCGNSCKNCTNWIVSCGCKSMALSLYKQ